MPHQIKKPPAFRRPVSILIPIQINQTNTAQHIVNIVWVCMKPNACLHKSGGLRLCKGRLKDFQTAFSNIQLMTIEYYTTP
jgi:hypothetical protein